MYDTPYTAENSPTYLEHVMRPLDNGEGVACFLATDDHGQPTVVFCTHVLSDGVDEVANDQCEEIRALQALAVQRAARVQAQAAGFHALIT